MRVKFIKADFEDTLNNIIELINSKDNDYFVESIFQYYPTIIKDEVLKLSEDERQKYILNKLRNEFKLKEKEIDKKILEYQRFWDKNELIIISKLEDIFGISLKNLFNDIISKVGLNPICPRFLENNTFDIFYLYSPSKAVETTIHEIVHFIWFKIWNDYYNDDYAEYECPNLKWIFSEIAISPILLDDRMSDFISLNHPAYEYFYNVNFNGKNLMKEINKIYRDNDILGFMDKGFKLCELYEEQIRNCMY